MIYVNSLRTKSLAVAEKPRDALCYVEIYLRVHNAHKLPNCTLDFSFILFDLVSP